MSTCFDRRDLFRRSTLAAGALVAPSWIVTAFAQDPRRDDNDAGGRATQLRAAARRAAARGKPVLVLLVPDVEREKYARGQLLGAWINHASDDLLLDLALCEWACATAAEVTAELPGTQVDGDPLLILIEPGRDGRQWAAHPIAPAADAVGDEGAALGPQQAWVASKPKLVVAHSAALTRALHAALVPDRGALAALADRERGTLADDEHVELESFFASAAARPSSLLLLRAAAVVRMAAEAPRRRGDRERMLAATVAAAKQRLVGGPITGSKWATTMGCGVTIEGEKEQLSVACGRGFVPEHCRRFLWFFTE